MMRKRKLDHLLRAAARVTGHKRFVIVGSTVVLVRCANIPGDMLMTPEADLYVPDVPDAEDLSDIIDANLGQGSAFHQEFGYYCDGVSADTAVMPRDWQDRSSLYLGAGCPGVTAIVPDPNDVALAKAVAWRDKDREWLGSGVRAGLFSLDAMTTRVDRLPDTSPDRDEMLRRLAWLAAQCNLQAPPTRP